MFEGSTPITEAVLLYRGGPVVPGWSWGGLVVPGWSWGGPVVPGWSCCTGVVLGWSFCTWVVLGWFWGGPFVPGWSWGGPVTVKLSSTVHGPSPSKGMIKLFKMSITLNLSRPSMTLSLLSSAVSFAENIFLEMFFLLFQINIIPDVRIFNFTPPTTDVNCSVPRPPVVCEVYTTNVTVNNTITVSCDDPVVVEDLIKDPSCSNITKVIIILKNETDRESLVYF